MGRLSSCSQLRRLPLHFGCWWHEYPNADDSELELERVRTEALPLLRPIWQEAGRPSYVRVDLHLHKGREVLLGELTFTSGGGLEFFM